MNGRRSGRSIRYGSPRSPIEASTLRLPIWPRMPIYCGLKFPCHRATRKLTRRERLSSSRGQVSIWPSFLTALSGSKRPDMTPSDGPERAYVFSVIERTSIKWYHEIFRKYVEGVTGLKPRVKRSGTLGTEFECFQGTTGGSMSINRVGRAGSPRGANPRAIEPPVGGF